MGCCFSSSHSTPAPATSPASYAAAVASSALQAVSNYIDPSKPPNGSQTPSPTSPTSPLVKQVIPHAHVTKMPDGDTFTCTYPHPSTGLPTTSRVRIMAIDCPETRQNYGREAADLGRSILLNATVVLHVHDIDRYDRLVADVVTADGTNFGEAMLAAGAAWHYAAYDKRPHLAALEADARARRCGLWAFARPQAPWDYRRRQRQAR